MRLIGQKIETQAVCNYFSSFSRFFNTFHILFCLRYLEAKFFYQKAENNLLELKPSFSSKINWSSLRDCFYNLSVFFNLQTFLFGQEFF